MCYASPGPRCSSSSLKRLQRIADNRNDYTAEEYEEALLSYYSTPAGFALLELREQQEQDKTDLIGYAIVNVAEFKALCTAYREKKLAALHEGNENVAHEYSRIENKQEFLEDGELRPRASKEDAAAYAEEATGFIDSIPANALVPLRWITSDGSGILNQYLVNGYEGVQENSYLRGDTDNPEALYSEEGIKRSIAAMSELIESHKREKPVVVYRGLKKDMFSDEYSQRMHKDDEASKDFCQREVQRTFVPGEVYEMKNFASTAVNPSVAVGFAHSDVMLEMKSRSVIPLGGVSNWGFSEAEMLSNQGTKFRVVGVKKGQFESSRGGIEDMIVVQLEEID